MFWKYIIKHDELRILKMVDLEVDVFSCFEFRLYSAVFYTDCH